MLLDELQELEQKSAVENVRTKIGPRIVAYRLRELVHEPEINNVDAGIFTNFKKRSLIESLPPVDGNISGRGSVEGCERARGKKPNGDDCRASKYLWRHYSSIKNSSILEE
jgi:hypothetical protein